VRALLAKARGKDFKIFVWHDADPSGYEIARTLAEETKRLPDHRIEIFDLGLNIEEAIEMGLQTETFTRKKDLSAALVERLTPDELRMFGGRRVQVGESKFQWHGCQRVEISRLTPSCQGSFDPSTKVVFASEFTTGTFSPSASRAIRLQIT
jgi:hypothetical protein